MRSLRIGLALRRQALEIEDAGLAELEVALAGSDTGKIWPLLTAVFGTYIPYEEEDDGDTDADSDEYETEEESATVGDQSTADQDHPMPSTSGEAQATAMETGAEAAVKTEPGSTPQPDVKPKKPVKRRTSAPPRKYKKAQPREKIPPPGLTTRRVSPKADKAGDAGLDEQHNLDRDPAQKDSTYLCRECDFSGNNYRSAVCLKCPGCPFEVWGTKAYLDHIKICPGAALHWGYAGPNVLTGDEAANILEGLGEGIYEAVPVAPPAKAAKTD